MFREFKPPRSSIKSIPAEFDLDYTVFLLAEGSPQEGRWIAKNMTYADIMRWACLKQYRGWSESEQYKQAQEQSKRKNRRR